MDQREPVLVKEDIVVCRLARSKQSRVAVEIVTKHYWTDGCCFNYHSRTVVTTAVCAGLGEEHDLVVLANDDERNFRGETQFSAGL